jgi:hypothetical protein
VILLKKNPPKEKNPIEVDIYNQTVNLLTEKGIEIHDKNIQYDQIDKKWFGNVKYFGNSTVDVNLDHDPRNNEFRVSLFLDNDYSEDGCPECLETDKNEVKKELKPLLDDLTKRKIRYFFNWE